MTKQLIRTKLSDSTEKLCHCFQEIKRGDNPPAVTHHPSSFSQIFGKAIRARDKSNFFFISPSFHRGLKRLDFWGENTVTRCCAIRRSIDHHRMCCSYVGGKLQLNRLRWKFFRSNWLKFSDVRAVHETDKCPALFWIFDCKVLLLGSKIFKSNKSFESNFFIPFCII